MLEMVEFYALNIEPQPRGVEVFQENAFYNLPECLYSRLDIGQKNGSKFWLSSSSTFK